MQAQSPFLKFNPGERKSHQSPRKKKLQSQLTLLSSPAPSNEFENILTGDSKPAKMKAIGGEGIDIGNLLSDIAAHHPELESPYTRRGVTPSPVYQSRKDKDNKDVLTDKIHSLERQIKALQQVNRETSLKATLAEESFRQALKTERGKLEKIITSLSTKLRDRNELIGDWISFVLNQPGLQSKELLEVMKKTIRVLPKLKNMLKPTIDSFGDFDRHMSRESSTHPNNLETDEILGEEETEGNEEATEDEGEGEGEGDGEVLLMQEGGSAKRRRKKRGEKTSSSRRDQITTADSDAEDLMSAIDEQIKMLEVLQGEQRGAGMTESQKQRHVVFKEATEGEPTSEMVVAQTSKKKSVGKKTSAKKGGKPPKAGVVHYSEKHEEQRTKRLEEEDVTTAEITKLLYESRVMHNNVLELSKEKKPVAVPIAIHVTSQNESNIFDTLFKETPEVSVDRLVATSDTEMTGEGAAPIPENTVTVASQPATNEEEKEEEKEVAQRRSEEVQPAPAPVPTPPAPALLSPAVVKLQAATKKLTSVDEFMKSIDSEDFSYDDVLRELFDSVSGLSQSLGDMDEETNQLISNTATTSTSITSSPGKGGGKKKKKSPAPPKEKKVVATAAARDSTVLLNTPLLNPQQLLAKLTGATSIPATSAMNTVAPVAPSADLNMSDEISTQRKEKKTRKKLLTSSLSEREGEEEGERENEEAHDELLRNTNKLIEHIQLHLSGELTGGGDDVDSGPNKLKLGGQLDQET